MKVETEIDELLKEKSKLELRLKAIKLELDPFFTELKDDCRKNKIKNREYGSFSVTYTPPREYFKLKVKLPDLAKQQPDLVESKTGFEKLRFTPIKPAWLN